MNVYETGYESGLAMVPGRSCDCSYRLNQRPSLCITTN